MNKIAWPIYWYTEIYLFIHAKSSIDKEKFRVIIKSTQERFSKLDVVCTIVETPNFSLTEKIYRFILA